MIKEFDIRDHAELGVATRAVEQALQIKGLTVLPVAEHHHETNKYSVGIDLEHGPGDFETLLKLQHEVFIDYELFCQRLSDEIRSDVGMYIGETQADNRLKVFCPDGEPYFAVAFDAGDYYHVKKIEAQ
ncbi:MAG: hypothetical protein AAFY59_14525 [Pseudomonadota bacterium]